MKEYYPYIDGIRAIAVILVFLFHLAPDFFKNGYIGVDVFFVISGFVITQALHLKYIETGEVSIVDFYSNRIRRLYPALVTMVVSVFILTVFFGFLWDGNLLIKSALFSLIGASNLYFLSRGEQYFNHDLVNPFFHTWSLGVEEQFYFIYPFLLIFLYKTFKRIKLVEKVAPLFVFSILFLSFVFSMLEVKILSDFYSPIGRFWEILLGCLAFFLLRIFLPVIPQLLFSFSGITLLLCGVLLDVHTKSISVLLATVGTFLILLGLYRRRGVFGAFLELKPIIFIGKISYSLYLWHIPVIYLFGLYLSDSLYYISAIFGTFLFATTSYYFVESPIRRSSEVKKRISNIINFSSSKYGLAVAVFLLILVSLNSGGLRVFANEKLEKIDDSLKLLNLIERKTGLSERVTPPDTFFGSSIDGCTFEKFLSDYNNFSCIKQNNSSTLVVLFGDSHAVHFIPTLEFSGIYSDFLFVEFLTEKIISDDKNSIDDINLFTNNLNAISRDYEHVFMVYSAYLSQYSDRIHVIESQISHLAGSLDPNSQNLILVAQTPTFISGPSACVLLDKYCYIEKNDYLASASKVNDFFESFSLNHDEVSVLNFESFLCSENKCFKYDKTRDLLIYMDDDHISQEMAKRVSPYFDEFIISERMR